MSTSQQPQERDFDPPHGLTRRFLLVILSVTVLLVTVGATFWMLNTIPRSRRRKPKQYATLVQTRPVTFTRKQIIVEAMGTVRAARQVTIFPRVRGEVVGITRTFLPGGLFRKGRKLLRIDAADYRLAVKRAQSTLAQARASLALEEGRQRIARREFKMLGKGAPKGDHQLMLRKPQLETARANVEAAQAALSQARLNLRRTTIRAPFDAIIIQRLVHKGSRVSESTPLLQLAGTRRYWVELAVAVDQLRWLEIPQKGQKGGSHVRIYNPDAWGKEKYRKGRILRLYPSLETQGRMARLLVEVKDPLGLRAKGERPPRLLLGSYVRARLLGRRAPPAVVLPRQYVRDNNTVWLLSPQNTLQIQRVTILFRGAQEVLIQGGLRAGQQLITTLLPTPVAGMPLRTPGQSRRKRRGRGRRNKR